MSSGEVWSGLLCFIWFAWFGFVWSRLNRSDCLVQVLSGLACFTFVWSKLICSGIFCSGLCGFVWSGMVRSCMFWPLVLVCLICSGLVCSCLCQPDKFRAGLIWSSWYHLVWPECVCSVLLCSSLVCLLWSALVCSWLFFRRLLSYHWLGFFRLNPALFWSGLLCSTPDWSALRFLV